MSSVVRAQVIRLCPLLFYWSSDHFQQVSSFQVIYSYSKVTFGSPLVCLKDEFIKFLEAVPGNISFPEMFFEEKIICGSQVVVHVGLKTLFSQIRVDAYELDLLEDFVVNRDLVVSNYQAFRIIVIAIFFPPRMLFHCFNPNPLIWVHCQNFTNEVLQFYRNMTWNTIFAIKNFSI